MPPSGQPVSVQIMAAIVSLFEGMAAGTDYYTQVKKVVKYEPQALLSATDRMVALLPIGSDYENERQRNNGEFQTSMDVRIFLCVKSSTDTVDELLRFERDAIKLLLDDMGSGPALGGLAVKTDILSSTRTIGDDRDSTHYVELMTRFLYRTPRTDLNTST